MAKPGKLAARRQREESADEDSVLLRSAETIGRVIGSLQRQLDGARNRLSDVAWTSHGASHANSNGRGKTAKAATRAKPSATKGTRKTKAKKAVKAVRKPASSGRARKPR